MKTYRGCILAVLTAALVFCGSQEAVKAADFYGNRVSYTVVLARAEEEEASSDADATADDKQETQQNEEGSASAVTAEQYEQLLANYNAASDRANQLEEKIRIMTALFLLIVAILLFIMFAILRISRREDFEEEDVFEEKTAEAEHRKKLPQREEKEQVEIAEVSEETAAAEEPPVIAETVKDEEFPAAAETDETEEPDASGEPEKKGKFRSAVLAYLGIGDAFSGEEPKEETPKEDTESFEEYGIFYDGAWDKTEDTPAEKPSEEKSSSGTGFFGSKKKKNGSEDTEDEDIEFIDL